MSQNKAPLYSLSVEEHSRLIRDILIQEFPKLLQEHDRAKAAQEPPNVISIDDASRLTGLKPATIYSKVSRGEMPALTRGRPLTFSRKALLLWIEMGKPTVAEEAAAELLSQNIGGRHEKRSS